MRAKLWGVAFTAGAVVATTLAGPALADTEVPDRAPAQAQEVVADPGGSWRVDRDLGSFNMVTAGTGAQFAWRTWEAPGDRVTGDGIGVALVDSGVSPVVGLDAPGKIVNGPDLSFDAGDPELRHLDAFGHGTHMAGIIAGRDPGIPAGSEHQNAYYAGMAPDAHIVNLKVATVDGSTDVTQVIAAIDWAVQHRNDPGVNIRVLSLSFGTLAMQPYELDPLAHAVESAWRNGIVVVVSAGNEGAAGTTLNNPAIDPYVIAVGAVDHQGTPQRADDAVADFSSVGNETRHPDVLAPGRSILGYRVPGSFLDLAYPTARAADAQGNERLFRGSGTSQAAAVTAGAVALLLDQRPELTPDQVKHLLTTMAEPVKGSTTAQGAGQLQLRNAGLVSVADAPAQAFAPSTGLGSLELARGGSHVGDPFTGEELVGEYDIFGNPWDAPTWAADSLAGLSWRGGEWNGSTWTGDGWNGLSWRYADWSGESWSGLSWRGLSWRGLSWRGGEWSGLSWRDSDWDGLSWRDHDWDGLSWRGLSWRGLSWRGLSWRTGTWSGVVWR